MKKLLFLAIAILSTFGAFAQSGDLRATATSHSVTLSLTTPYAITGVTFTLNRGTASGAETPYQTGLASLPYVDTGVTPATTYYYTLQAVCTLQCQAGYGGTSPASNEVKATTPANQLPAPVLNPAVVAGNPPVVDLTWTLAKNTNVIRQFVQRQQPKTLAWTNQHQLKPTVNQYIDAGVKRGTSYPYRIQAIPKNGPVMNSNIMIAVIPSK